MPKTTTHQDRLHHRRRRADRPVHQDRAPVPRGAAAPPRRLPAAGHRRGAAQVGGRRRAHPHDLPADHRRDRAAVLDRPQPAEHPDPHRGGPPDPRGVHRGRGLRVADVRRLQPDRDADHGAPVRRRGPDRGVPLGRGPAPLRRVPGVRRGARGRHEPDAQQGQGDVLRARLRAVGVRPVQAARHLHRRGQGPDGRVLPAVRRGARLPARRRRRGPRARGTPRPCWAGAATCPT